MVSHLRAGFNFGKHCGGTFQVAQAQQQQPTLHAGEHVDKRAYACIVPRCVPQCTTSAETRPTAQVQAELGSKA